MSNLEETNRRLDEQLQSALEDVGDKTTELETVSIESVTSVIELGVSIEYSVHCDHNFNCFRLPATIISTNCVTRAVQTPHY